MLIVGIFFTVFATLEYFKAMATKNWPTADATIKVSEIEETTITVRYQGVKPFYKPIIRFAYSVDGATYTGNRIKTSFPPGSIKRPWATAITSRYPFGAQVKVHYDPADHSYAVLETGTSSDNTFFFVMAGVGLVFGVFMTLAGKAGRKKRKQEQSNAADQSSIDSK